MDADLQSMSQEELHNEVMKLREGIRKHRDQKGDENCWLDDQFYLYGLLPEKTKVDPQLPEKPLMMLNCSRYYDCRKSGKEYIALDSLPKKIEFAVEWISVKDRIPPFDSSVVVINANDYKMCLAYNESYSELMMTRLDPGKEYDSNGLEIFYRKVPFEVTHWYPLPKWPEEKQ